MRYRPLDPSGRRILHLFGHPARLCKTGCRSLPESRCYHDAAGATYPYGVDPDDTNIRIAPTYPTLEELEPAARILCLCIKIATIEKMIAQTSEKETAPQAPYAIAQ